MNFPRVDVDGDRVMHQINELGGFSSAPAPAVTRVLFSPEDLTVRRYLKSMAGKYGLRYWDDAIGNIRFRWDGSEPALPCVGTGSHTDAIPYSGKFDGVVGVLGGLELVRALKEADFQPRRSIDVIMFTAEEPTLTNLGCIGSRALAGTLTPAEMCELSDVINGSGLGFDDLRRQAGFEGELDTVRLPEDEYSGFVELHTEQGKRLEDAGIPIGVVTNIAASSTIDVTVEGEGGHAGAVMMPDRQDAFTAVAELALEAERLVREHSSPDAVVTVGECSLHPSASNSIPSKVVFSIDLRDKDAGVRDELFAAIERFAVTELLKRRGVRVSFDTRNCDPSSTSDRGILETIRQASDFLGYPHVDLVSRAFHDTVFMAQRFPTAMIFVPSKDGHSHRPEEYTSPEEIRQGIEVLALTLAQMSME